MGSLDENSPQNGSDTDESDQTVNRVKAEPSQQRGRRATQGGVKRPASAVPSAGRGKKSSQNNHLCLKVEDTAQPQEANAV